jgi:hypothetical protein
MPIASRVNTDQRTGGCPGSLVRRMPGTSAPAADSWTRGRRRVPRKGRAPVTRARGGPVRGGPRRARR